MALFKFFRDFIKNLKLRNLVMLTAAGIINAFGITVFLSPVKLYDSGISAVFALADRPMTAEESIASTASLLEKAAYNIIGLYI